MATRTQLVETSQQGHLISFCSHDEKEPFWSRLTNHHWRWRISIAHRKELSSSTQARVSVTICKLLLLAARTAVGCLWIAIKIEKECNKCQQKSHFCQSQISSRKINQTLTDNALKETKLQWFLAQQEENWRLYSQKLKFKQTARYWCRSLTQAFRAYIEELLQMILIFQVI